MALARVTAKGQVTIPAEVRKALDIGEGDDLLFEVVEAGEARIRVLKRGLLSDLYEHFRPHAPTLARRRFGPRWARVLGSGWRDGGRESALGRRQCDPAIFNERSTGDGRPFGTPDGQSGEGRGFPIHLRWCLPRSSGC